MSNYQRGQHALNEIMVKRISELLDDVSILKGIVTAVAIFKVGMLLHKQIKKAS